MIATRGPGEVAEGDELAGVRAPVRGDVGVPGRQVDEVADARHRQHLLRPDRRAVGHGRREAAVRRGEVGDEPLVHVEGRLVAEPVRVVEEDRDGQRVEVLGPQTSVLEEGLERVGAARVEVPADARAQEHVRGHLLAPERHRVSDQVGVDPSLPCEGSGGDPVRPRPDHQQVCMVRQGGSRGEAAHRRYRRPGLHGRRRGDRQNWDRHSGQRDGHRVRSRSRVAP
jgi:hypothetical protein